MDFVIFWDHGINSPQMLRDSYLWGNEDVHSSWNKRISYVLVISLHLKVGEIREHIWDFRG